MASSRRASRTAPKKAAPFSRSQDEGYATAAAVMISLALAMVASAISSRVLADLKLARADQERTAIARALGNVEQAALLALIQTKQTARLTWESPSEIGPIQIVAEPEALKLDVRLPPNQSNSVRQELDDSSAGTLDASLRSARADPYHLDLGSLAGTPIWRACAASILSPWGGETLLIRPSATPVRGAPSWRIGEIWRIRVTGKGWSEDRIVRFTGEPGHPAAILRRRMTRQQEGGAECDKMLSTPGQVS